MRIHKTVAIHHRLNKTCGMRIIETLLSVILNW